MKLFECFDEYYDLISENNNDKYKIIEDFLDDDGIKYAEPLKAVFLHKTLNEMFLVLDCLKVSLSTIISACNNWESRILNFVNMGNEFRGNIEYLKYNISLLILCNDDVGNRDDDYRYETEKSLKICRKIFLLCDSEGEMIDDKTIIPFYFTPVQKINNKQTENLECELECLLSENDELLTISNNNILSEEDINIIQRWLDKDDNN